MKNKLLQLSISIPKINRQALQMALSLLVLALLALGAGAPMEGGTIGK
jgi:hypothetical protein